MGMTDERLLDDYEDQNEPDYIDPMPMPGDHMTEDPLIVLEPMEEDQRNLTLYLDPAQLVANDANDKARPAEGARARKARVAAMVQSLTANGQTTPISVVEVDGAYEYVDGGCRVEAMVELGWQEVWATKCDPADDLFRTAVVSNLHRTQHSLLDMAQICREVRERHGWKGRGGQKKVAEYLGIAEPRVSEFEKLLYATDAVKARIESGEIGSLDAALKLLSVEGSKQEEVAARAAEIAAEEEAAKPEKVVTNGETWRKDGDKPVKEAKPAKPKVKAKHVAKAAAEVEPQSAPLPTLIDVKDFFRSISFDYPAPAYKFAKDFLSWLKDPTTTTLSVVASSFSTLVGKTVKATKPSPAAPAAASPKKSKASKLNPSKTGKAGGRGSKDVRSTKKVVVKTVRKSTTKPAKRVGKKK